MMRTRMKLAVVLVFGSIFLSHARALQDKQEEAARYAEAGQKAMASGQYAEARQNFEQLAKLEPNIAEVHATLGAIYFKQREYERTIREVRTALKLKPSLPRLDSLLGLAFAELGRFDEALPLLEKGFHQTADSEVRRMCGLQLLRAYPALRRDSDAVETSLALNKLYPDNPEVLYHTGRIYGIFAYTVMTKLKDTAPGSTWTLQAQGELHEAQNEYEEAIFTFNHILEIDPLRPGIHYRLGRVYLSRFREHQKSEDREAAQREFIAELTNDPRNGNAKYELANIETDLGNLAGAAKLYEEIVERFPDFEEALVGLGGVYLDSHEPAKALAVLERAIKLNPKDDVAWYRIARADRATGNKEAQLKALATFQELSKAKPQHRPVADEEVTPQHIDPTAQDQQ